ncbi:MAG: Na(+)-translocating NADH-quinone reductase subunit C [Wenzhouxiangella sp.]|nr:Na(+)-translocating NADH-quinone reductase subunit C [Wenzhouxiangella sp.]
MRDKNSVANVLRIATVVCLICAVIVSTAAVTLRPFQAENRETFRQLNVLQAAGLFEPGMDVAQAFERIERRVVDFDSGEYVDPPGGFDPVRAVRDPAQSNALTGDPAGIGRRTHYGEVFLARSEDGALERVVLPVHAYGLWSTMYAFLALEPDLRTVSGISFFEHGETPGLGGEIENPRWQQGWVGKQVRDEDGDVRFRVDRGRTPEGVPDAEHRIDGLSGATITSRGVENMVQFWLGEQGYGPFLAKLENRMKTGEVL